MWMKTANFVAGIFQVGYLCCDFACPFYSCFSLFPVFWKQVFCRCAGPEGCCVGGGGRRMCPAVAQYIEYKNKTQEKCNYCTIYQCISGFYKKNVELHLLLILAIDSVIYSFYVTILLCKKAPVFD